MARRARRWMSAAHPFALVDDADARFRRCRPCARHRARRGSCPPSGIASRALMTRLSSASSSWLWSLRTQCAPSATVDLDLVILADRLLEHRPQFLEQQSARRPARSRASGGAKKRAIARSACPPARAEASAPSAIRRARASRSLRLSRKSSAPTTGVSRLLKSCAIPPVSWPSASSFCCLLAALGERAAPSAIWRSANQISAAASSKRQQGGDARASPGNARSGRRYSARPARHAPTSRSAASARRRYNSRTPSSVKPR